MLTFKNFSIFLNNKAIINHLTAQIPPSLVAIIGPNGAGKTTLLKAMAGFVSSTEGVFSHTYHCTGYLPQQLTLNNRFPMTVFEVAQMGLFKELGLVGRITKNHQERITEALQRVGLSIYKNSSLGTLSGGQFQRLLFARLILQNADLLLLDEPFSAIDEQTILSLLRLIKIWEKEKRGIFIVLHQLHLVKKYFPYTLMISPSFISFGKTEVILTEEKMREAFFSAF